MLERARRRTADAARDVWAYAAALAGARSPREPFVVLSPPRLPTQIVFDRRARESFRVALRARTSDWPTFRQIFVHRDYDLRKLARHREILERFDAIVAAGRAPLIVDCGANIGLSTLWFARSFPAAHVVAVEPEAENCALARANCARANAAILHAAVAASDSNLALVDTGLGSNAFRTRPAAAGEATVAARSVPSLLEEVRQAAPVEPFLIKIDIEGFEDELFAGDADWIDRFPVLIIELHDWMLPGSANSANFLRAIAGRNRDFVFHGENVFSIRN